MLQRFLVIFIVVILFSEISAKTKQKTDNVSQKIMNSGLNILQDRFIFGISYFNAMRHSQNAVTGRFEYRSSLNFLNVSPFAGIACASSGAFYGMAGIYTDIRLNNRIIFTPSFAAGYFNKGTGIDLAFNIEFRTQFELSYILNNNSRIGIGFYHISNGSFGKSNPGAESITLIYSVPFN